MRNTPVGVVIEIEGRRDAMDYFVETLPREGPPLMRVAAVEASDLAIAGDESFVIRLFGIWNNVHSATPARRYDGLVRGCLRCVLCLGRHLNDSQLVTIGGPE